MDVFVGIVEDRHTDVGVEVFLDPDKATLWARKLANEFASGPVGEHSSQGTKSP